MKKFLNIQKILNCNSHLQYKTTTQYKWCEKLVYNPDRRVEMPNYVCMYSSTKVPFDAKKYCFSYSLVPFQNFNFATLISTLAC